MTSDEAIDFLLNNPEGPFPADVEAELNRLRMFEPYDTEAIEATDGEASDRDDHDDATTTTTKTARNYLLTFPLDTDPAGTVETSRWT